MLLAQQEEDKGKSGQQWPAGGKISAVGGAVFANRAVAWLGAHSLNATKGQSTALSRFVRDFMSAGDPAHPSEFVLTSDGVAGIIHNWPLIAAFLAFFLAQFLKVFTFWYSERRWDFTRIAGSGGMPSSHTACVIALTTSIGAVHGMGSEAFAIGLVFSLVVMYDASGVRLHAGRQASVLNMIITELPPDHPVSDTRPLRDSLGHTPLQVAVGAMLGFIIGYVVGKSVDPPIA